MGTICTGTLTTASGRPIAGTTVSASLAPLWVESGVIGFSATETITSNRRGSFTMNHLGVNDLKADPDAIHVLGAVVTGSWNNVPLAGALVFIRAYGFPVVGPRHRLDRAASRRRVTAARLTSCAPGPVLIPTGRGAPHQLDP